MALLPTPPSVGDPVTAATIAQIIAAIPITDSGSLAVPIGTANTDISTAVAFTSGRFSSAPNVQVSASVTHPGDVHTSFSSVSSSGFTLWVRRVDTTTTTVNWSASITP